MFPRRYRPPAAPRFPLTGHGNGRHFFNPGQSIDNSPASLLKWKLTSQPVRWPASAGGLATPSFAGRAAPHEITATLVGHATFLLQFDGLNILTDPVWSDRCSPVGWAGPRRVRPPAIPWDALPDIDLVLLSHNHYDHCDLVTLRRLEERFHPLILTGLGNRAFLEFHGMTRVEEADWWDSYPITRIFPDTSARITFTPAVHWSNRGGNTQNTTLWGGFHLANPHQSIFFAGDSAYGPLFTEIHRRLGPPDLALLPIGAYEPRWFMRSMHLNPAEAVLAHQDLHATRSLGMHYGTWQLTGEGLDDPVHALTLALQESGLPPDCFVPAGFGRTYCDSNSPV
jgi:L-ascorbate metabolism protein UlaG (beta-lactamase superfamily)